MEGTVSPKAQRRDLCLRSQGAASPWWLKQKGREGKCDLNRKMGEAGQGGPQQDSVSSLQFILEVKGRPWGNQKSLRV